MNALNRFADLVYCIMRLIVGLMFACHGGQKLLGFPGGGHGGVQGLMLVGGIIELVGGLMIAFGFLTRLAAFVSAGEMAVAYFMVHAAGKAIGHPPTPTEQFFPILNKGELAVVLCWLFLFMVFYGGGRWSIDSLLFGRKTPTVVASKFTEKHERIIPNRRWLGGVRAANRPWRRLFCSRRAIGFGLVRRS